MVLAKQPMPLNSGLDPSTSLLSALTLTPAYEKSQNSIMAFVLITNSIFLSILIASMRSCASVEL